MKVYHPYINKGVKYQLEEIHKNVVGIINPLNHLPLLKTFY